MSCERYQQLMMGYLDDELDDSEIEELKQHLAGCPECRMELEQFKAVKNLADSSSFSAPEDKFWEGYRAGIYYRLERRLGWFLLSIGSLILSVGVIYSLIHDLIFNSDAPIWIRVGLPITLISLVILLVSIARERYRVRKFERYKDVRR